jgi:DNA-binding IclR family transcriptional regulator
MGFGIGALASGFERHVSVPEQLYRCVRSVAVETGEAVYGSGWADSEIVILARQPGTQSVNAAESPLGLSVHAHARASGKLLLALAEVSRRDSYLARRPPVPLTPNTLGYDALLAQLAFIAKHHFATDQEEFSLGVCCLSVPCRLGETTFALALSAPAERFNANFDTYLEVLRDVAGTESVQVAARAFA